jgi:hypothetical protein
MDSSTQSGAPSPQPPPPASGAPAAASPQLSHRALEDFAHRANQQIGSHDQQIRNQAAVIAQLRSEIQVLAEAQAQHDQTSRQDQVFKDDQRRRLIEFLNYEPECEQQMQLFAALAAWHATEPRLVENRQAEYTTKKGGTISYGYADLASVIATGQTAGAMGLFPLTRQELDDNGTPVVTGYLVHSGGGCISSGPVPLFIKEAVEGEIDRRGQAHAAGLTTCRRLALQMVLGLAAERDDDFNAANDTQPRQARQSRDPQQQPVRTVTTPSRSAAGPAGATQRAPSAAVRQGPPPGWISKDDRRALEQELTDPAITPERSQEIEAKLLAADQLAKNAAAASQGNAP